MTRKKEIEQAAKECVEPIQRSARLSDRYDFFIQGSEWADKTMLDKACEWLKENMSNYIIEHPFFPSGSSVTVEGDKMVEVFRKAMEE